MDGIREKRAFASLVDLTGTGELNSNAQSRVDARQLPKPFLSLRVQAAGLSLRAKHSPFRESHFPLKTQVLSLEAPAFRDSNSLLRFREAEAPSILGP